MEIILLLIMLMCIVIFPIYVFAKKIYTSTQTIEKIKYSVLIVFLIIMLVVFIYLKWKSYI